MNVPFHINDIFVWELVVVLHRHYAAQVQLPNVATVFFVGISFRFCWDLFLDLLSFCS